MHKWGDKWFREYGQQFGEMARWFERTARRYGRLGGDIKEKYGELRFYVIWHHGVHDLVYPGYVWHKSKLLANFDYYVYRRFGGPVRWLIQRYQVWFYRWLYRTAVKRWPAICGEIVAAADYPELLE